MMKHMLAFAFFTLAAHLLDAARHYKREKEAFSTIWNYVWGIASALIGFSLL